MIWMSNDQDNAFNESTPPEQKQAIESLVTRILAARQTDPAADVHALETEIDHLVYQLYNLTPEEIATIESCTKRGEIQGKE